MIEIHRGLIQEISSDAIVNPVEPLLVTWARRELNRISQYIYEEADEEYYEKYKEKLTATNPTECLVTYSYNLKPNFQTIINCVLPVVEVQLGHSEKAILEYLEECKNKKTELKCCYQNILDSACKNGLKSISIPVLGVQTFSNFPVMVAVDCFVESVREWMKNNKIDGEFKVKVVVMNDECLRHLRRALHKS